MISERLYTMIFGKRWNKQAHSFAVSEGYRTPRKEEFEKQRKQEEESYKAKIEIMEHVASFQ